jgi:osmotically inducible protein OsmC
MPVRVESGAKCDGAAQRWQAAAGVGYIGLPDAGGWHATPRRGRRIMVHAPSGNARRHQAGRALPPPDASVAGAFPQQESRMKKTATAAWSGDLKTGKGTISTQSGALKNQPYGFNTRFGDTPGTNPEELLGAAHAGCFTMALSNILSEAGLAPQKLDTQAEVTLDKVEGGFAITAVHLTVEAVIPGASAEAFDEAARKAEKGCPVSKVLNAKITMDAKLRS